MCHISEVSFWLLGLTNTSFQCMSSYIITVITIKVYGLNLTWDSPVFALDLKLGHTHRFFLKISGMIHTLLNESFIRKQLYKRLTAAGFLLLLLPPLVNH